MSRAKYYASQLRFFYFPTFPTITLLACDFALSYQIAAAAIKKSSP